MPVTPETDFPAEARAIIDDLAAVLPAPAVLTRYVWEGAVTELDEESFTAHLKPVSGNAEEAIGSFWRVQVGDDDQALLELDAVFWMVSEVVKRPSGHVEGRNTLRFRRPGEQGGDETAGPERAIAERERPVHESPEPAAQIRHGIAEAEAGLTVDRGSFAQYLENDGDD